MVLMGRWIINIYYNLLLKLRLLDNFRIADGKLHGRNNPRLIHLSMDYSSECWVFTPYRNLALYPNPQDLLT